MNYAQIASEQQSEGHIFRLEDKKKRRQKRVLYASHGFRRKEKYCRVWPKHHFWLPFQNLFGPNRHLLVKRERSRGGREERIWRIKSKKEKSTLEFLSQIGRWVIKNSPYIASLRVKFFKRIIGFSRKSDAIDVKPKLVKPHGASVVGN